MKWPVTVRPQASADLEKARDWYEARRPGLGIEFVFTIRKALETLRANPLRYAVYYNGFRRVLLPRFPYKIFFRIEGERIIVFRVLHARQDHSRHLD